MILRHVHEDPNQALTVSLSPALDGIVGRLLAEGNAPQSVGIEDVIVRAHAEGQIEATQEALELKRTHGPAMRFSSTRWEKD